MLWLGVGLWLGAGLRLGAGLGLRSFGVRWELWKFGVGVDGLDTGERTVWLVIIRVRSGAAVGVRLKLGAGP